VRPRGAGVIPAALYLRAGDPRITTGLDVTVPIGAIAVVLLGVPAVLAALGWLTAGRPRPLAALRS
jgi:hypothetical protein